jgi:hypothetical protein
MYLVRLLCCYKFFKNFVNYIINMELDVTDKLDKEFINLMIEIEQRYVELSKQVRLRIESWVN